MNELWAVCDCGWTDHVLRVQSIDDGEGLREFIIEVHLVTWRGFWRRLWYGLRYAFGHKSSFGAFDEVILSRENVVRLRDLCNVYLAEEAV